MSGGPLRPILEQVRVSESTDQLGLRLVYGTRHMDIFTSEVSVAEFLLTPPAQQPEAAASIEERYLHETLYHLRQRIKRKFDGELELPFAYGPNGIVGLRIWTKPELEEIQCQMKNPGPGIVEIVDPDQRQHLYIDGHEILPDKDFKHISHVKIEMFRRAKTGKGLIAEEFKDTWRYLTHKEITKSSYQTYLSLLRSALQAVGLTLTKLTTPWETCVVSLTTSNQTAELVPPAPR